MQTPFATLPLGGSRKNSASICISMGARSHNPAAESSEVNKAETVTFWPTTGGDGLMVTQMSSWAWAAPEANAATVRAVKSDAVAKKPRPWNP
jgi:hypothetical protein